MHIDIPKSDQGRSGAVERLAKVLNALDAAKAWEVTVAEKKRRRSEQQNRYLWGVVYKTICEHLEGWDAEDVHEYFLGECYGWTCLSGLGRNRIKPVRRSARLNKMEFADYIAFIQRKMAERGVFIPDAVL
jgi:hypothetical protein